MARFSGSWQSIPRAALDCPEVGELSFAAECLFWRLYEASDGYGRYDARPGWILGKVMTARIVRGELDVDGVEALLDELEGAGLVRRYQVEDRVYLGILDYEEAGDRHREEYPRAPWESEPISEVSVAAAEKTSASKRTRQAARNSKRKPKRSTDQELPFEESVPTASPACPPAGDKSAPLDSDSKLQTETSPQGPPAGGVEGGSPRRGRKRKTVDAGEDWGELVPKRLDTPAFREAWAKWRAYTVEQGRAAPGAISTQELFSVLEGWGPLTAIAGINQSIARGYTGVTKPNEVASIGPRPDLHAPSKRRGDGPSLPRDVAEQASRIFNARPMAAKAARLTPPERTPSALEGMVSPELRAAARAAGRKAAEKVGAA